MSKTTVTSETTIKPKEYFDELYRSVGGVQGLRDKRIAAGYNQQIRNDMYPRTTQEMATKFDDRIQNDRTMDYTKALLDDPDKILTYGERSLPNQIESGGTYDSSKGEIAVFKGTSDIGNTKHHELVHDVQYKGDNLITKPNWFDEENDPQTWYPRTKAESSYDRNNIDEYFQARPEIDARIGETLFYNMQFRNKPVITEQDADELWDYMETNDIPLATKKALARLKKGGITKEHFRSLAPRLVEDKTDKPANSKILRDPNYV
jgi:hypothetical protein